MWRTPRDAPLLLVDLAALVRVEEVQGLLEARRVEQEHQVVVSAVADELYDFSIILYGIDDLIDTCVKIKFWMPHAIDATSSP